MKGTASKYLSSAKYLLLSFIGSGLPGLIILMPLFFEGYYDKIVVPKKYSELLELIDPVNPGRGVSDYPNYPIADIPKSYAMILSAESNRYRYEGIKHQSDMMQTSGKWLIKHSDEDGDGIVGWGLPFSWDAYGDGSINPKNTEYTITTGIVINALIDWMEMDTDAPKPVIIGLAKRAFDPYINAKYYSPSGLFAYSLEVPDSSYDCFNPSAYIAGQMQRFSTYVKDLQLRNQLQTAADQAMLSLLKYHRIDPNGGWYWSYSLQEFNIPNDIAHAGYIIEGIRNYIQYGGAYSNRFDWNAVFLHLESFSGENYEEWYAWPNFSGIDSGVMPRLYGIGMTLYLIAKIDSVSKRAVKLVEIIEKYRLSNGHYAKTPKSKNKDEFKYIVIQEYEAYLLHGLSYFLYQPGSNQTGIQKNKQKSEASNDVYKIRPEKEDHASRKATFIDEKKLSILPSRVKRVIDILNDNSIEEETSIPLTNYNTQSFKINAIFNITTLKFALIIEDHIDKTIQINEPGIPLKVLEMNQNRLFIFYRSLFSNSLVLVDYKLYAGKVDSVTLDKNEETFFDFREAIIHRNELFIILYDSPSMKNFLIRFRITGAHIETDRKREILPSLEDPAGSHYEITPALYMIPDHNDLYIIGGRLLSVFRNGKLITLPSIPDCMRVTEAIATPRGLYCLYKTKNKNNQSTSRIFNITRNEKLDYDSSKGMPWQLRWENGSLAFNFIKNDSDLSNLVKFDFLRCKASGAFYMGTNNVEGRAAWSQLYYLNGLIDIIMLSKLSDQMYEIFHDLIGTIKKRLDLEIYLLDRLIRSEYSIKTKAFTVNRTEAIFAVQSSRFLLLFNRYKKIVNNSIKLESHNILKDIVFGLKDHIEILSDHGESEKWLKKGRYHLRWPKGCDFFYDGTPVPYNHQNEWAQAILQTNGIHESDKEYVKGAKDILLHFSDTILKEGKFPSSGKWPYWWGTAYDGWKESDNVSKNMKSYAGDRSNAWISFRTIDSMAILSGGKDIPGLVTDNLIKSILALTNKGLLYPFIIEELIPYNKIPSLDKKICNEYIRITAPWEIQNSVWAYLCYPVESETEDPHSNNLNKIIKDKIINIENINPRSKDASKYIYEYLSIALPYNLSQAKRYIGVELCGKYLAWNLAYDLRACMIAFEKTDDIRFLKMFINVFDDVLKLRDSELRIFDDVRKKFMNAWGTNRYTEHKKLWTAWDAFAGMILFPAAKYCRLVTERGYIGIYREKADEYEMIIKNVLDEFEPYWRNGPGKKEGYYYDPYYKDIAPLNHMNALGRVHIEMYKITMDNKYKEKAVKLAFYFKRNMLLQSNDSYVWHYWPRLNYKKIKSITIEDVTHAQINLHFAVLAYKNGIVFYRKDMD